LSQYGAQLPKLPQAQCADTEHRIYSKEGNLRPITYGRPDFFARSRLNRKFRTTFSVKYAVSPKNARARTPTIVTIQDLNPNARYSNSAM
jgi:hypothetical protein